MTDRLVTLAVPTLRRYDLLASLLVPSAERGSRRPDRYYIVDNGGSLDPTVLGLPLDRTTVYRPGRNLGVSASWNHGHSLLDEYVVWVCDDMEVGPTAIEALVAAADAHPDVGYFFPAHNAGTMFGLNILRRWAFEKIGPYDESFWPAYFEDNDYAYRIKLAGVPVMAVEGASIASHVGSATLKSYTEAEMQVHHSRFEALRAYYVRKWGGPPGQEKFVTPFQGGR